MISRCKANSVFCKQPRTGLVFGRLSYLKIFKVFKLTLSSSEKVRTPSLREQARCYVLSAGGRTRGTSMAPTMKRSALYPKAQAAPKVDQSKPTIALDRKSPTPLTVANTPKAIPCCAGSINSAQNKSSSVSSIAICTPPGVKTKKGQRPETCR